MRLAWNANHTRVVLKGMEHVDIDPTELMRPRSATPGEGQRRSKRRSAGKLATSDRAMRLTGTRVDHDVRRPNTAAAHMDRPRSRTTTHVELQQRRARGSFDATIDVWTRSEFSGGCGARERAPRVDADHSGTPTAAGLAPPAPRFSVPGKLSGLHVQPGPVPADDSLPVAGQAVEPRSTRVAVGPGSSCTCAASVTSSTVTACSCSGEHGRGTADRDVVDVDLLSGSTRQLLYTPSSDSMRGGHSGSRGINI